MTNSIDRITAPAVPTPPRIGQATAIEQSRAAAEVAAAVMVAQQCPRDIHGALAAMRDSCRQTRLAERAFYRYRRGDSSVSGPTVHLARELARCFGNLQYGISELRRDDAEGYSEMLAYAWDVQTNTRAAQIFVVPHMRDKKGGPEKLVDLRDIYEQSANQGARRLRAAIFSILPPWFVEEAEELCSKTLEHGGGKPLAQRVADAIKLYGDMGIATDQLEQKLSRSHDRWTDHDVAQLGVIYRSLQRGETLKDEEFPPPRVTAAEIAQQAAPTPSPDEPGPTGNRPGPPDDGRPAGSTPRRRRKAAPESSGGDATTGHGEPSPPEPSSSDGGDDTGPAQPSLPDGTPSEPDNDWPPVPRPPDAPKGDSA